MEIITIAEVVAENEYTEAEVTQGYIVCSIPGYSDGEWLEVIQRIDRLDGTILQKFDCDTEAGEQAARDGLYLFTSDKPELRGRFILDTPANRSLVERYAWEEI